MCLALRLDRWVCVYYDDAWFVLFLLTSAVVAPLSEVYGRLPLYHSCSLLFIVFTVLAAVSTNMSMFIAFRFLMGCKFPPE
jgi:MFS family permease